MKQSVSNFLRYISPALLWLAQPPLAIWPFAFVAIILWLCWIVSPVPVTKRDYTFLWVASTLFWLATLQGLRHAHPAMYFCWGLLSAYLAVFHVGFVVVGRRMVERGVSLTIAAPVAWVAQECVRNYLLTGISAAMLGHTMADVPFMIQIADLFGTYGIGAVLVSINVAIFLSWQLWRGQSDRRSATTSISIATTLLVATLIYGYYRTGEPTGEPLATFALLQRDEEVNYEQSYERQEEIFQNYARQAIEAVRDTQEAVDIVVWPESMFSGATPWMTVDPDLVVPAEAQMSAAEFQASVNEHQRYFSQRAKFIQTLIAAETPGRNPPELIAGCGVVRYADVPQSYSAVVHVGPDGEVVDWYGKTHLVLVGEYIPIINWIPSLRSFVPHLDRGDGAKRMNVAGTGIAPNICIETAVERVTVNQFADLVGRKETPDVIVTVTNDGWFDDSSVIEHHLRCAQLVAVSIRRPVVSAANNGPTASIDSSGAITARLNVGSNETLITTPNRDDRKSVYAIIGAIPAWLCVALAALLTTRRRNPNP